MVKKDGMRVETFVLLLFLHVLMAVFLLTFTELGLASLVIVLASAALFLLGNVTRSNKANKLDELREDLVKAEDENKLWEKFHKVKDWELESDYQKLTSTSKKGNIFTEHEAELLIEKGRNDLFNRMSNQLRQQNG